MELIHSNELLSSAPSPIEYLVDGFLTRGGVVDVSGPPGEGKSTLVMSMASHISTGAPWFGLKVSQTPVAWVTGEASSKNALARDLHRLALPEDTDITFVLPCGELFRWLDNQWNTTQEGAAIIKSIRDRGVGMVVLDTIGSLVSGSKEIDNDQQRQLAPHLRAEFAGLTCVTISHTNQSSAKDDLAWRLHYLSRAGGNGFPGALRWAGGVAALTPDESHELGLPEGLRYVAFGASKHNEMPRPVWTNRSPAVFEIRDCGGLVLARDGREVRKMEEKKEVRHGQQRPPICTL